MSPENFIDKVNLLVNVGNRIITYKNLSQELKIHVNKAKQYLMEYYNEQKSLGLELEVNYFLAGFVEVNGLRSVRALVVSGDYVEEAKESFAELTSCHIYSILKGVSKDEHALYSSDYSYTQNENRNKYSAIQHPNIELKPPILTKMPPIKDIKSSISKKVESNISNGKSTFAHKAAVTAEKKSPKIDDVVNDKPEQYVQENKPGSEAKSGTLMSMWSKKDLSHSVKAENSKSESKAKVAAKSIPKNNILTMFSKQAVKNFEKPPAQNPAPKGSPKSDSPVKQSSKEVTTTELKKTSQKRKMTHKKSNSSKIQHNSDSDNEYKTKPKKHRRICTFDSDSESEPEEEKEKAQRSFFLPEEPMEASAASPVSDDSEEPIPPTPPVSVKGKAKAWKTVKKTYEDEEGFFVTKTEKELVSASEDEEDPLKNNKDKKKEAVEMKNPIQQNKKQASLMSFFKHK